MLEPRALTVMAIVVRIVIAVAFGGVIGMERGMKNRPAGLRTYMLVTVGACVVMLLNQYVYQVYETGDPVRLGAQVISGIGFLGAGTIIVTSHNQIKGLTTAAGLWASACVGLTIGIGLYEVALAGGIAIFVVLTVIQEWDYRVRSKAGEIEVYIELEKEMTLGKFLRNLRDRGLEMSNLQRETDGAFGDEVLAFVVTIRGKERILQQELARIVRKIEGVKYMEVL